MKIVSAFFGLFIGKYAAWMWGLLAVIALAGMIGGAVLLYKGVVKENNDLKVKTGALTEIVKERENQIKAMDEDQQDFMNRANLVVGEMNKLQDKMARNVIRRQSDVDNIVTKPGTKATIAEIETKANTGTNTLFKDLESLSREGLDEKSK